MKRALSFVVLSLAFVGSAFSQVVDDRLIVSGKRIGRWSLETTIGDLTRANGRYGERAAGGIGANLDVHPELELFLWQAKDGRFIVYTFGDKPRVELITVGCGFAENYKTDKGIGCDATREAVERAYGRPPAETAPMSGHTRLIYDETGLQFRWVGGDLLNIGVFRPGSGKRIFKF